jgi:polyhydroxyalkanoate synthesis regulator phasin
MAAAKRGTSKKSTAKRSTGKRSGSTRSGGRSSASRSTATAGLDKSIESFRDSLERSVTISRERLQEVVDDAVKRGRLQRRDAEKMVSDMVSRGRRQTSSLLQELERVAEQARKELRGRSAPARRQATQAARRAARQASRAARDVADRPLAEADRLRRRTGLPALFPITAYDQLTANQVKARLKDLTAAELRKVREYEKRHQNRKGVITAIDKKLA